MKCDTGTKIQESQQGTVLGHPLSACIAPCWFFIGDKMKTCSKCKETKSLSEFYKSRRSKDGRQGYCKSCVKAYQQRFKGKAAISDRVVQKAYHQNERGKAAMKRFYARNPNYRKATHAVYCAVRAGRLPRPDTLQCHYCPNPAQQYHHWHGYEPECWLDVVPACVECHTKEHRKIA